MTNPSQNQGMEIPSQEMLAVRDVVKGGIFRRIANKRRMEKAKVKRKTPCMSQTLTDLML